MDGTRTKPAKDAFDVLKAIVILGLPFVHLAESYAYLEIVSDSLLPVVRIIVLLTLFGPGIFMICMGVGMAKSRSFKRLRKMGIQMVIINLALNFFRFCLPYFVAVPTGLVTITDIISQLFASDIYTFVGLFFILYSFVKQKGISNRAFLALSVIGLVVDAWVGSLCSLDTPILSTIAGNFISCAEFSSFPLLGWAVYPCIGIVLEENVLERAPRGRNGLMALLMVVGAAIFVLGAVLALSVGESPFYVLLYSIAYADQNIAAALMELSFVLVFLGAFYLLFQVIPNNPLERFFLSFSPLLFPFYLLQWIFVALASYYAVVLLGILGVPCQVDIALYTVLALAILGISLFITLKWGFSLSRWAFKVSDYSKWFKRKKSAK